MDDENAKHCEQVEERVAVSRRHHKVTGLKCLRLCDKYDWLNDGTAAGMAANRLQLSHSSRLFVHTAFAYVRDKHSA